MDAREGRGTTARNDLMLSKSFWKQVATQQRQQRLHVEAERKILLAIVNSQGLYIESMRFTHPKDSRALSLVAAVDNVSKLNSVGGGQIDDLKWPRLKSSVSSLYTTYLQEVKDCYARMDQVFRDDEMESLPVGKVDTS
ncbi:hypothetical protein PI124_g6265 [Phytophthora idaei]|nr:hypothetical protein PI125_g18390 [Phytophthora idaei]KAG3140262.1 hypothetical protein PI126_g16094 [Phytophthora idaei]KAG3249085.1 hypothetical protein PI124_g6265 [Phytophthora idaei]